MDIPFSFPNLTRCVCHVDNALASNDFEFYRALFIRLIQPSEAAVEARLLGLLIVRALLSRLNGAHKNDFAHEILLSILRTTALDKIAHVAGETPEDAEKVSIVCLFCS